MCTLESPCVSQRSWVTDNSNSSQVLYEQSPQQLARPSLLVKSSKLGSRCQANWCWKSPMAALGPRQRGLQIPLMYVLTAPAGKCCLHHDTGVVLGTKSTFGGPCCAAPPIRGACALKRAPVDLSSPACWHALVPLLMKCSICEERRSASLSSRLDATRPWLRKDASCGFPFRYDCAPRGCSPLCMVVLGPRWEESPCPWLGPPA